MKQTFFVVFVLTLISNTLLGQPQPKINIHFSKLYATYDFVQKLSPYYPDNEYKQLFLASKYNTTTNAHLIAQIDTLDIYESYSFQKYSATAKKPVMTTSIIQKNLISSGSFHEFKSKIFGLIPSAELIKFSGILEVFQPVYDSLVYLPNKKEFETKLAGLSTYVQQSNLSNLFNAGLGFYNSRWDDSVPLDITIIPSKGKGFTATAFFNQAVSEVPLDFNHNDILFSVLMHEIYHIQYDEQPLEIKQNIERWFNENSSQNSAYAYLLLDEVLATSVGNGYVFEQLSGKPDTAEWYNNKYINLMAKEIYPTVKEYLAANKTIDRNFINKYVSIYDNKFPAWNKELDHLLTYRYVITNNEEDLLYFSKNYRYKTYTMSDIPVREADFQRLKETPISKIIIISSDNKKGLGRIKETFPELKNWKYNAKHEFVYTTTLEDKTRLIVINRLKTPFIELFEREFKNKRIQ